MGCMMQWCRSMGIECFMGWASMGDGLYEDWMMLLKDGWLMLGGQLVMGRCVMCDGSSVGRIRVWMKLAYRWMFG